MAKVALLFVFVTHCCVAALVNTAFAAGSEVAKPKKIIFLHFYLNDKGQQNVQPGTFKWVESSIGKAIHDSIKGKYNYVKIPDEEWQQYRDKNNITDKQMLEPRVIRKMGFDLGADGIVYGDFYTRAEKGGDVISVEGRILSVIDGDVIAKKRIEETIGPKMFNAVELISNYLAKQIKVLFYPSAWQAVWRSALIPGWGQMYKRRRPWAYNYAGLTAAGLLAGSGFGLSALINRNKYNGAGLDEDAVQYLEAFERDRLAAQIAFGFAGVVYVVNIFDAWLLDGDYEALARPQPQTGFRISGDDAKLILVWHYRLE